MGTYNPNYKSTSNLLKGLRGLISTDRIGAISTLNRQVFLQHCVRQGLMWLVRVIARMVPDTGGFTNIREPLTLNPKT